jgi:hypothetical protein
MNFLQSYINFVSEIGRRINQKSWWYTSLSSKNRFQSQLLPYFEFQKLSTSTIARNPVITPKQFGRAILAEFLKSLYAWIILTLQRIKLFQSGKEYLVIKTFGYSHNYSENLTSDAYWGRFPQYLQKSWPVVQIVKPIGCFKSSVGHASKGNLAFPYHAFVSPMVFFRAVARMFKAHLGWSYEDPSILQMLKNEIWNDSFFHAFLMEEIFKTLSNSLKMAEVFIPYEGNSWERGVVAGLRRSKKKIFVTGYVHTVVPEISTNLFPGQNEYQEGPFPDKIMVLGQVPRDLLNSKGHYPEGVLRTACALRFEYLNKLKPLPYNSSRTVLVVLEGVFPAAKVVDYILKMAPECRGWNFSLRFHPALPWEKLKAHCQTKEFPANVSFSKPQSLKADIENCEICLYWGSTAGIEALYLGRPVIHLDLGSALSFDPLFAHEGYHWKIRTGENLFGLLQKINSLSEIEKDKLCSESRQYLENYFLEVTDDRMQLFLKR